MENDFCQNHLYHNYNMLITYFIREVDYGSRMSPCLGGHLEEAVEPEAFHSRCRSCFPPRPCPGPGGSAPLTGGIPSRAPVWGRAPGDSVQWGEGAGRRVAPAGLLQLAPSQRTPEGTERTSCPNTPGGSPCGCWDRESLTTMAQLLPTALERCS